MHTLSINEIEELASHRGACKADVENFLDTVGQAGTLETELLELYYNARLYDWNTSTIRAIEAGIRLAYVDEVVSPYLVLTDGKRARKAKGQSLGLMTKPSKDKVA